jgi:hypothetical protein
MSRIILTFYILLSRLPTLRSVLYLPSSLSSMVFSKVSFALLLLCDGDLAEKSVFRISVICFCDIVPNCELSYDKGL